MPLNGKKTLAIKLQKFKDFWGLVCFIMYQFCTLYILRILYITYYEKGENFNKKTYKRNSKIEIGIIFSTNIMKG